MTTFQAIETRYAGCRFRSRLEARWAVFFDHLGIAWEYEPEGYELPSGRYLPDFWLPEVACRDLHQHGVWFEVKNDEAQDDPRWPELVAASQHALVIGRTHARHAEQVSMEVVWLDAALDDCLLWTDLVQRDAEHTFCDCGDGWSIQYGPESNLHSSNHPRVELALIAARSARFEFGEIGQHGPAAMARVRLGTHRRGTPTALEIVQSMPS